MKAISIYGAAHKKSPRPLGRGLGRGVIKDDKAIEHEGNKYLWCFAQNISLPLLGEVRRGYDYFCQAKA